jgi:hypothetical protein
MAEAQNASCTLFSLHSVIRFNTLTERTRITLVLVLDFIERVNFLLRPLAFVICTMEDFFAPIIRFCDLYYAARERDERSRGFEEEADGLVEVELITGSSAEDTFLHCGFTWSDYYSFAHGKMVWISRDAFFDSNWISMDIHLDFQRFLTVNINEANEESKQDVDVFARSKAHAKKASDILLQLLTTSESRDVELDSRLSDRFPVSGLAFSHFLVHSRNLRVPNLRYADLDTCHCRAIDSLTRTDLQIYINGCAPTESGQGILLECIRQNRGPTGLSQCRIDAGRLADALRGNTSVTFFALPEDCSDEERLVLVEALAENEGLVTLDLEAARITDERST